MEIHTASHFPKTHRTYCWPLEGFFSAFAIHDFDFENIFVFGDSLELTGVVTRNTLAWRGSN